MTGHRQKGKGHKRLKSWHRGKSQGGRWARIVGRWPDLGVEPDPALAVHTDVRRASPAARRKGDVA